jgi:hypothetical protein
MGLMMICCGMTVKRRGMWENEILTVKMETLALIGNGR